MFNIVELFLVLQPFYYSTSGGKIGGQFGTAAE
jgi:hypothetical protein